MTVQHDLFKSTQQEDRISRTASFAKMCMTSLGIRLPSELTATFTQTVLAGLGFGGKKKGFGETMQAWIEKNKTFTGEDIKKTMSKMLSSENAQDAMAKLPDIDHVVLRYRKKFASMEHKPKALTNGTTTGKKRKAATGGTAKKRKAAGAA